MDTCIGRVKCGCRLSARYIYRGYIFSNAGKDGVLDDHLKVPPGKKTNAFPRLHFRTVKNKGVWGDIHLTEEDKIDMTKQKATSIDLTRVNDTKLHK